jgi:hypothetical protein
MSTNPHDPRPQAAAPRTRGGTGTVEPRGAYVDQAITIRNPTDTPAAPDPAPTQANALGNVRKFYAEDKVAEIDQTASNPGVDPPPHAANKWEIETTADGITRAKDPYRNDGMISQNDSLQNQG